jgi:hypothetical protein
MVSVSAKTDDKNLIQDKCLRDNNHVDKETENISIRDYNKICREEDGGCSRKKNASQFISIKSKNTLCQLCLYCRFRQRVRNDRITISIQVHPTFDMTKFYRIWDNMPPKHKANFRRRLLNNEF